MPSGPLLGPAPENRKQVFKHCARVFTAALLSTVRQQRSGPPPTMRPVHTVEYYSALNRDAADPDDVGKPGKRRSVKEVDTKGHMSPDPTHMKRPRQTGSRGAAGRGRGLLRAQGIFGEEGNVRELQGVRPQLREVSDAAELRTGNRTTAAWCVLVPPARHGVVAADGSA